MRLRRKHQAVAAWTGNGGYKSLLQVVMVMGLGLSAITLAFNQDWRAWLNWFLGATLIYMCLMVPRMDVQVTDRVNPSLAPAAVANVPLGLALMASFTSQAGDYLIQTERTYSSIAHNAMKWVPILNVVLTVVFYALFPVLFPLFLMPKTGPIALRGYVTGFFYLAAWGPLFVILHMILMLKGASDVAAAGGAAGLSLATFSGMTDVNNDIGILAGYLVASIPFLAGGVARGALAISGQATSYLNPSQNAAEEAAREASTGNVSLGNTSLENSNVFSRQFAQASLAPNIGYGAAQTRATGENGTQTTGFPQAEFATVPTSSYPFTPTLGRDFSSRLATMASQSRGQSETFSNLAQQSTSSAVTRFSELRDAYTNFRGIELRDFPAEIARLALIIAEFQCDVLYRGQKEALADFLPLDSENWDPYRSNV